MTDHIGPYIEALATRAEPVTLAEYSALRMNSWEREHIIPNVDNETLAHITTHCLQNCSVHRRNPSSTYEEALVNVHVPELLKRLAQTAATRPFVQR